MPILNSLVRKSYNLLANTPLRKIPGMWNISDMVFKIIWHNVNTIEVAGNKMCVNLRDPNPAMRKTFHAYMLNLVHEEATTLLFKKVVKPGYTVLDLGANIGYFSLLAARLITDTGRVFSFEPEPTNFAYLQKNIALNNFKNISAFKKAVSGYSGKTRLYICSYDTGHHTINQDEGIKAYSRGKRVKEGFIEIDMVSLDEFLKDKVDKVDIIKMDVEGAEGLAITGMSRILKDNFKIKVFLEFFPLLIEKMKSSPANIIDALLNEFKFDIYVIGHDYSMHGYDIEYRKINSYQELADLRKEEADHFNLYLTREPLPELTSQRS